MDIAKNIRHLRLRGNMTQEELACRLGCTSQAVSKWERGEGYPEITLIPQIAKVFNVSADKLFGMDEERRQERIEEYFQRVDELTEKYMKQVVMSDGRVIHSISDHDELFRLQREIGREALREFAGDTAAELRFVMLLGNGDMNDMEEEVIEIYERVLGRVSAEEENQRIIARIQLAQIYEQKGESERAEEIVKALPSMQNCFEHIMLLNSLRTRGRRSVKCAQQVIEAALKMIDLAINAMLNANIGGEAVYSAAELAELWKKNIDLVLFEEVTEPSDLISYCLCVVRESVKAGLREQALEYLEKAADFAEEYGPVRRDIEYTNILLRERREERLRQIKEHYSNAEEIRFTPPYMILMRQLTQVFDEESFAEFYAAHLGLTADQLDRDNLNFIKSLEYNIERGRELDPIRGDPRYIAVLERMRKMG